MFLSNSTFVSERLTKFIASGLDGLYYLSHASILVILNKKTFLFDPVQANPPHYGYWLFYPKMHYCDELLSVDFCIISHQHQDHLDVGFLKCLNPKTSVLILEGRPQLEHQLIIHNISFTVLSSNILGQICNGIKYFGLNHESNGIDSAIVISNDEFSVYHGNDCYLSEKPLMALAANFNKIDVACIPFAYIHWYPFLLENINENERHEEANRLIQKYMNYGISQIQALKPELTIPFGANMFYYHDVDSEHNQAVLTPHDFWEFAKENHPELSNSIYPLFAGAEITNIISHDILGPDDWPHPNLRIKHGKISKDDLKKGFLDFILASNSPPSFNVSTSALLDLNLINLSFIVERLNLAFELLSPIAHDVYISLASNYEDLLIIPLDSNDVRVASSALLNRNFHHFKLTEDAYAAYLSSSISLGEILATSQFTIVRIPNVYNPKALQYINNFL